VVLQLITSVPATGQLPTDSHRSRPIARARRRPLSSDLL